MEALGNGTQEDVVLEHAQEAATVSLWLHQLLLLTMLEVKVDLAEQPFARALPSP
jgi:hypothetical protein